MEDKLIHLLELFLEDMRSVDGEADLIAFLAWLKYRKLNSPPQTNKQ